MNSQGIKVGFEEILDWEHDFVTCLIKLKENEAEKISALSGNIPSSHSQSRSQEQLENIKKIDTFWKDLNETRQKEKEILKEKREQLNKDRKAKQEDKK